MILKTAKRLTWSLFCIFLMLGLAGAACNNASGINCTIEVSATIEKGCLVNNIIVRPGEELGGIGTLNFGIHRYTDTGTKEAIFSETANFNMKCTLETAVMMAVDGGNSGARKMERRGEYIPYQLYRDAAKQQKIAINEAIPLLLDPKGNIIISVYGVVELDGNMSAGVYQDTLIITFSY